ncbi:hypothetical protein FXO38_11427 [Capsicum annuum]|uniref:Uncharacterized protein n=1 Tax=Capsicum annuum TaxID=4072 RepID=A0A2G2YLX9_CAPAN|nr:hypothetical protein FXO37_14572 [Capsicum annuum]KAF3661944.1 hypothetical protein FXO38_11427 [Capsicum annuum]PHT70759.1 hypothetical protein T459_25863 [Capsicum annuum]
MGMNSEQNDGWEVYARKPQNKGGKSAGKDWSPQNLSIKAWAKNKTKTWGHPDVFDLSGVYKNFESRWGSRYNWYAPNDPRKLAMTATSAYPKNTSPVADDDKVSGQDIEDNE